MWGRRFRSNIEWPYIIISDTLRHHTKYMRQAVTPLHGKSDNRHASFPNKSSVIQNWLQAARSFFKIWQWFTCSRPVFLVCNLKFIIVLKNYFVLPKNTNEVWKRSPFCEMEAVLPGINYRRFGQICCLYLQRNIHFTLTHHLWLQINFHTIFQSIPSTFKYSYLLTYSMEQSPSWEANWFCS